MRQAPNAAAVRQPGPAKHKARQQATVSRKHSTPVMEPEVIVDQPLSIEALASNSAIYRLGSPHHNSMSFYNDTQKHAHNILQWHTVTD